MNCTLKTEYAADMSGHEEKKSMAKPTHCIRVFKIFKKTF